MAYVKMSAGLAPELNLGCAYGLMLSPNLNRAACSLKPRKHVIKSQKGASMVTTKTTVGMDF